ncbi:MAG: hypothetical protein ABJH08_07375 [Balneola sp.]
MKNKKESSIQNKQGRARIVTDSKSGIRMLTRGNKLTKEEIDKDFPKDGSRENDIIRSSYGLDGNDGSVKIVQFNFKKAH